MIKKASNQISFILLWSLILLVNGSCSDKKDFEFYFTQTALELQDPYEIDSIKQEGFSDWTLKAYIKITEKDKKTIINKLRKERKFHSVANEKFYVDNFRLHTDTIHGYIIDSKYYFGIYKKRLININGKRRFAGYQTYDLQLDTITNKLFFNYEYE